VIGNLGAHMEPDRIEHLLMNISNGDRAAFRDLFVETAPEIAGRLAAHGAEMAASEQALIEAFAQVWEGEYRLALRPDQSLIEWLFVLARAQLPPSIGPQHARSIVPVNDALWAKVATRAYPESWRNILRRTDVIFGIIGAVVWAVILKFVVS